MNNDDEVMSAEEFFGGLENEKKAPVRKGRGRAKKSANDLFAEVKVKMVMRIYGVTKARALEILADRADEKKPSEASADNADEIELHKEKKSITEDVLDGAASTALTPDELMRLFK